MAEHYLVPKSKVTEAGLDMAVAQIRAEYLRARQTHAPMHSPHEGFAVIYEEFMVELADHVWHDTGRSQAAYEEATQVAAMALAYMLEVAS